MDETSVYEEEIEKMLAVDMAGIQVEDSALTEEKEAQIEQLKNMGGIADLTGSSVLDNVGVSASVSTAHSRLRSFILATVIDVFVHMNKRTAVTRRAPSQG